MSIFRRLLADKETEKERLRICNECEHLTDRWLGIIKEISCGVCKCSIPKKIKFKNSECPKKKW